MSYSSPSENIPVAELPQVDGPSGGRSLSSSRAGHGRSGGRRRGGQRVGGGSSNIAATSAGSKAEKTILQRVIHQGSSERSKMLKAEVFAQQYNATKTPARQQVEAQRARVDASIQEVNKNLATMRKLVDKALADNAQHLVGQDNLEAKLQSLMTSGHLSTTCMSRVRDKFRN